MKRRRILKRVPIPLQLLLRDQAEKRTLDRTFRNFRRRAEKTIRAHPELRFLKVPLERLLAAVEIPAYGEIFGPFIRRYRSQKK